MEMGNRDDPRDFRYISDDEALIRAARTGFDGDGKALNDREIIQILTSECFTDEHLYEAARRFAPIMEWDIEVFVEQARKIGRSG